MPKKVIFDQKNIVVVGGAGFLGSHLCERMVRDNKVICIDNFSTGTVDNIRFLMQLPNFRFIKHDITQPLNLEEILDLADFKIEFQGIQEIYNLACPTSAKNFDSLVIHTLDANSLGMKNILEMTRLYEAKLLHFSSAVVYGSRPDNEETFPEDYNGLVDFVSPRACYDEGKRFAETMAVTYRNFYDLSISIARVFRTYGPKMPLNDGQMIPDFIVNALDNKDLIIYGDDKFTTSLTYVDDIVDGLFKIVEQDTPGIFNLGSDRSYRLGEVAQKIIALTNSQSKIIFKDPLRFMTPLGNPDISKARRELQWFPVIDLEEGLAKTIDYTKANKLIIKG
ncbi:MAG: GDP-mannose 4,6-dehydratase [Candidatus Komeilibacteria bacterium]|nr:GDP-mannose 4,6-dehydratase [Candidatus Komeilibacteria bacterium]